LFDHLVGKREQRISDASSAGPFMVLPVYNIWKAERTARSV